MKSAQNSSTQRSLWSAPAFWEERRCRCSASPFAPKSRCCAVESEHHVTTTLHTGKSQLALHYYSGAERHYLFCENITLRLLLRGDSAAPEAPAPAPRVDSSRSRCALELVRALPAIHIFVGNTTTSTGQVKYSDGWPNYKGQCSDFRFF